MRAIYVTSTPRLRLLLLSPFLLPVGAALLLIDAALGASGAAAEVRYPDGVPVIAGILAAMPTLLYTLLVCVLLMRRATGRVRIDRRGLLIALPLFVGAAALLLAYAGSVGDPEHYKGSFNAFTQRWDPHFAPGPYLALIVGISTFIPMGVIGAAVKLLYIDAVQPAKLDKPEGLDPIGIMLGEHSLSSRP